MTDIQIPLHQNHQKGMNGNGKYNISKNSLEIRGGGVGVNSSSTVNDSASTKSQAITNSHPSSAKKSINKFIEKNQNNLTNIQVYPRILDSYSTIVSFNLFDVKSNNSNNNSNPKSRIPNATNSSINKNNQNSKFDVNTNSLSNLSQLTIGSNKLFNANNNSTNTNTNKLNNVNHNHHQTNHQNHNSHSWHDESNSGWTSTGVMSDRSSVYSIDDGDFDREASRKVNNQLREIESILYEQNSTHSSILVECKEWLEKFPHIRILGTQLLKDDHHIPSSDNLRSSIQSLPSTYRNLSSNFTGVTSTPSSLSTQAAQNNKNIIDSSNTETPISQATTNTEQTADDTQLSFNNYKFIRRREQSDLNNQNLYLNGTSLPIRAVDQEPTKSSSSISNNSNTKTEDYSFLEEEIFAQDGTYEELLAYDNQEEEYLFEHNKRLNLSKRRRHGLPPITPKSSMKDLVTNMLFDYMWGELINWSSQLIQTYSKTISDDFVSDSSCKTPQPTQSLQTENGLNSSRTNDTKDTQITSNLISSSNNSNHVNNNNNNSMLKNEASQLNNNNNNNNLIVNSNLNTNNNVNSLNINSSLAPSLTKANVIQLKPFDSSLTNTNNYNNNTFYHLLDKQAYTPGLLSRDNSNLYAQSKFINSDNLIENKYNYAGSDTVSTVGDLMLGNIDDILKIKQLNKNGVNNVNKNLTPVIPQNRVGSGSNRRQIPNNYRKRYSSIEMSTNLLLDKNIIIHGAGLAKPSASSLNHLNDSNGVVVENKPTNSNGNNSNNASGFNNSSSNSFLPLSNINTGVNSLVAGNNNNNRNNNNSSHANHISGNHINEDNSYENDYNDYNYATYHDNGESSIDEINLLHSNSNNNNNNSILNQNSRNSYYYNSHSHYNYGHTVNNHVHPYHGYHNHSNHSNNFQPLPPIENSLTFKPLRISSANNLKQTKEKNDRPMTSTATRFESNMTPLNKRSTTPSGLASINKFNNNLYTNNMKITGVRLSAEDPLYLGNNQNSNLSSLSNYLSTKSFTTSNQNNNNAYSNTNSTNINNQTSLSNPANRRNSIKDGLLRFQK